MRMVPNDSYEKKLVLALDTVHRKYTIDYSHLSRSGIDSTIQKIIDRLLTIKSVKNLFLAGSWSIMVQLRNLFHINVNYHPQDLDVVVLTTYSNFNNTVSEIGDTFQTTSVSEDIVNKFVETTPQPWSVALKFTDPLTKEVISVKVLTAREMHRMVKRALVQKDKLYLSVLRTQPLAKKFDIFYGPNFMYRYTYLQRPFMHSYTYWRWETPLSTEKGPILSDFLSFLSSALPIASDGSAIVLNAKRIYNELFSKTNISHLLNIFTYFLKKFK